MVTRALALRLAGRLAGLVGTLLAAAVLVFLALHIMPGDPAELMLGINADPAAVAALREQMGLDEPLFVQFGAWLSGVVVGDFGTSLTYGVPVSTLLMERASVSVPLAVLAVTLTVAVALPVAVAAAVVRDGWADRTAMAGAQILLSVPNIWLGLVGIYVFAVILRWVPAGGFPGWSGGVLAGLTALALPAIALAAPQAAILARLARIAVGEAMDQDYVALARAKGLSARQAAWRHALPTVWAPIVTIIGLQFGFLLAGAIIIETVFSLPGLGRLLFQAVSQRDIPVVEGVVLLVVAAVVVANGICDLLAIASDPRQSARRPVSAGP